jgi:cryptochrome
MNTSIVWFRKSLRLHDNPALSTASEDEDVQNILPLFIVDPDLLGEDYNKHSPSRLRFLIESLSDLDNQLSSKYKSGLILLKGRTINIFERIEQKLKKEFCSLYCEYSSEPWERKKLLSIVQLLRQKNSNIHVQSFGAFQTILDIEKAISLPDFRNPKSMKDIDKLFSSNFEKNKSGFYEIEDPLSIPDKIQPLPNIPDFDLEQDQCGFYFSSVENLADHMSKKIGTDIMSVKSYFIGGETEALSRLNTKVSGQVEYVNTFRKPKTMSTNSDDAPMEPSTTGLSPYLSVGCLSVRMLWKECEECQTQGEHTQPPESLHGQMMFREMFYLLSRTIDRWDEDSSNEMCKEIKWGDYDKKKMEAWENGQTGFPLIDAMMRQLNTTGWMHHLGRHAVSCFLTRGQLWQNWKCGRDVFDKKLLDSDWALNNGNWLWLSGVAPFSMPYFRLYNPCPDPKSSLNVESKTAEFIKHWVPELKNFPTKYIYEPHLAPSSIQSDSNCIIGQDYPNPMVDRKESAKQNLTKFKSSLARNKS